MSHLYGTVLGAAGTFYPDPDAALVASRAYFTTSAGSSTFVDGSDALVYQVMGSALSGGSGDATLFNDNGDVVCKVRVTPNSPMVLSWSKGIRVEDGFYLTTSVATISITVVYDKVAK